MASRNSSATRLPASTNHWWIGWLLLALLYVTVCVNLAGFLAGFLGGSSSHPIASDPLLVLRGLLRGELGSAFRPPPNIGLTWACFVLLSGSGGLLAWRLGLARLLIAGAPRVIDGARWAGTRDERRLYVPADPRHRPGRMVVGYSTLRPSRLLAGEDCASVTAFGVSGSGKTFRLVVPNVLEWDGPVIMSTTRGPELRAVIARRACLGPVHIIAPGGVPGFETSCWSPVDYARDEVSAYRMADWLCTAAQDRLGDADENRPWIEQATSLIAPILLAAHVSGGGIRSFVRWLRGGPEHETVVLNHLTRHGFLDAAREFTTLRHIHDRGQGSVRFTAFTITRCYRTPEVQHSASRTDFTADELLDNRGTLLLVSPVVDSLYATMFTALTASVVYEATKRYEHSGNPLEPRLGLFLDEAGNVFRTASLAKLLTNVRAMGIQLMTIWHDLSQLENLYGPTEARTILSQSRMKLVLPGVGDDRTLDYVSRMLSNTLLERPSVTVGSDGRQSTSGSLHTEPLAPLHQLQQLATGTALVQYDNMPPTRCVLRDYWRDSRLHALSEACEN